MILLKLIVNLAFGHFFNRNFGRNFWKISIFVKIVENSRFCSKFFSKNADCATNILKLWFRSMFSKISILFNICRNLEFGWNFRSIWIMLIFLKNHQFTKNCRKILVLNSTVENLHFDHSFSKISIFVTILENLNFDRNFRKMSIFVKIHHSINKCRKISILINFVKEISISVKIFKKKKSTTVRMFEESGFYQQFKFFFTNSIFIKIF